MLRVQEQADILITKGYRKTSNKFKIVSRIDKPNWLDLAYSYGVGGHDTPRKLAIEDALALFYKGMSVKDLGFTGRLLKYEAASVEDYYRRCISKDKIEGINPEVFRLVPGSGSSITGFIK